MMEAEQDMGVVKMGDEVLRQQTSRAAIAARLRWLIEDAAGSEHGAIQRFCEKSGANYGRIRNALAKVNQLSTADAIIIKKFCRVDLDFIYEAEVSSLPFEIAHRVTTSARMLELYQNEGVDPPHWLSVRH